MTPAEAWALCSELERLLAQPAARDLLHRAYQIETRFFSDLQADSYLLTIVARVVDDLEAWLAEAGEADAEARALLREGPMRDSLERLKSAVRMCYPPEGGGDPPSARSRYANGTRRDPVLTAGRDS